MESIIFHIVGIMRDQRATVASDRRPTVALGADSDTISRTRIQIRRNGAMRLFSSKTGVSASTCEEERVKGKSG